MLWPTFVIRWYLLNDHWECTSFVIKSLVVQRVDKLSIILMFTCFVQVMIVKKKTWKITSLFEIYFTEIQSFFATDKVFKNACYCNKHYLKSLKKLPIHEKLSLVNIIISLICSRSLSSFAFVHWPWVPVAKYFRYKAPGDKFLHFEYICFHKSLIHNDSFHIDTLFCPYYEVTVAATGAKQLSLYLGDKKKLT